MSIRHDTGNKKWRQGILWSRLDEHIDGKRRLQWEAGDVEGRREGNKEPDSLWVIVLAWLQLVTSSLEARALEWESHEGGSATLTPCPYQERLLLTWLILRTRWPTSVCPGFSDFCRKVSSLGESQSPWSPVESDAGWWSDAVLQEVMLSWTQYFYQGRAREEQWKQIKSMVYVGDVLFSHFRFQDPWLRERRTKLLLLRFLDHTIPGSQQTGILVQGDRERD